MDNTPTSPPGQYSNGQGSTEDIYGSIEGESETASSPSIFLYFFIAWLVLIVLCFALITIVLFDRCQKQVVSYQNKPEGNGNDVETDIDGAVDRQREQEAARELVSKRKRQRQAIGLGILFLALILAFVASIASILSCQFVSLDQTKQWGDSSYVSYFGMWSVSSSSNECREISELLLIMDTEFYELLIIMDTEFHFARASSVIASLFGGICIPILLCFVGNKKFGRVVRALAWPFTVAFVFQMFTLFIFDSEVCSMGCSIGWGAMVSVTAALYWLLCCFSCAFIPLVADGSRPMNAVVFEDE